MNCEKCCDIDNFRMLGQERLTFAKTCKSAADWAKWPETLSPFLFKPGECWTFAPRYVVKDFAAECGFLIDGLGLHVNTFSDEFAMFMPPGANYYFSVVPESENDKATAPDSFGLEFMLDDIVGNCKALKGRGVCFESNPSACSPGSSLYSASFRTPNGIKIVLWGVVQKRVETDDGSNCCVDC